MWRKYDTIIYDKYVYTLCVYFSWNFLKNAKVEIEKITYSIEDNDTYTNTKNDTEKKYAQIVSHMQKIW